VIVTHPPHREMRGPLWLNSTKPMRLPWGLTRWRAQRACRRTDGHWWHSDLDDWAVGWFCCQCGALREGVPWDGT
jgi:hypothetical protein